MQLHIRGLDTFVLEADSFETINDIKVKFTYLLFTRHCFETCAHNLIHLMAGFGGYHHGKEFIAMCCEIQ